LPAEFSIFSIISWYIKPFSLDFLLNLGHHSKHLQFRQFNLNFTLKLVE
jgi:hypothetical protein